MAPSEQSTTSATDADLDRSFGPSRTGLIVSAVAAVVAFVAIAVVSLRQSGPTVHPDEWGFLTNGQAFIGHVEAPLPTTSFYPAGFGLVTGIGALLTGSIQGAYRFTLLVNLVLALCTAWAAVRLARTVFGLSRPTSRLVGLLVLVLPGTLLSAVMAWPEIAARLAFIVLVVLVHRASVRPDRVRLASLAIFTGLLPALHGRFTLVLGVVGLSIVWMWRRHIIGFGVMVQSGCILVVGYVVSHLLNGFIKSSVYLESYDQENRLLRRLTKPRLWPAMVRMMVGQGWYLVATTAGLFGVGIAFAVGRSLKGARSGVGEDVRDPLSFTLAVTWASVAVVLFTGSLQLLGFNRGDHLIYGRYVELTVPVVVVLAVAALVRAPSLSRRAWAMCVVVIPTVALVYVAVDRNDGIARAWKVRNVVFPNIVGTDAIRYVVPVGFLPFAAAFTVVAALLWLVSRRNRGTAIVCLVLLLSVGLVVSANRSVSHRTRFLDGISVTTAIIERDGAKEVAFDSSQANDPAYYFLRYKLHPVRLRYVRATLEGEQVPAGVSCMYEPTGVRPANGDWTLIAEESAVSRVLWRRVGADRC